MPALMQDELLSACTIYFPSGAGIFVFQFIFLICVLIYLIVNSRHLCLFTGETPYISSIDVHVFSARLFHFIWRGIFI